MPKIRNIAPIAISDLFPSENMGGTIISKPASNQRKPATFFDCRTLPDLIIITFSLRIYGKFGANYNNN